VSDLATVVRTELSNHLRQLADRVEQCARCLPPDQLWAKPFGFGNSVGHLVLHLTGNLNHFIGARIAGTGYVRDRDREFAETDPPAPEDLIARFREAVALVETTLASRAAEAFTQSNEAPNASSQFGTFLVCLSHMNNHLGQMVYLVRALGHDPNGPLVWPSEDQSAADS